MCVHVQGPVYCAQTDQESPNSTSGYIVIDLIKYKLNALYQIQENKYRCLFTFITAKYCFSFVYNYEKIRELPMKMLLLTENNT